MFNSARLKLTIWYLLIIMVISISFSIVIFRVSANEVERFDRLQRSRIQNSMLIPGFGFVIPQIVVDPTLVAETERRIVLTLIVINSTILIVSGITGYFLAGLTLAPIAEMVDEQNRFISDASHEINTPLTSLKTAMEVYLRDKSPKLSDSKVLVKESIEEVNKLQALSTSLLALAQYQKPQQEIKFENVSIKEIVDGSIKRVNLMAKEKEIVILAKTNDGKVYGDKYALTDLFVILLDNAIKYSNDKSKIEVSAVRTDGHVEIKVKDHGIGIEKRDQEHIFDRFYRTDGARSKKTRGGYGLGLSIAKKIVDSHNGSIAVESVSGKGSIFSVKIPVAK